MVISLWSLVLLLRIQSQEAVLYKSYVTCWLHRLLYYIIPIVNNLQDYPWQFQWNSRPIPLHSLIFLWHIPLWWKLFSWEHVQKQVKIFPVGHFIRCWWMEKISYFRSKATNRYLTGWRLEALLVPSKDWSWH